MSTFIHRVRRMRATVTVLLLVAQPLAFGATLSPQIQSKVRAATFEIVMKKPQQDSLEYERPLPLDLLPYKERTDEYISIGTAFAIAPDRFVTAAHVLNRGFATFYGAPALRDASGEIYPIGDIIKFALHKDFAVFSVQRSIAVKPLQMNRNPRLDRPVYAVGNALGEGIVVRDGLLTSQTPEEKDGRWSWLRFSAAASPGNSGGPLLDDNGRVIGIVLRKSANENLNFALPISVVFDSPSDVAQLESDFRYGLPVLDTFESAPLVAEIALPKPYEEFCRESIAAIEGHLANLRERLLQKNADSMFPRGEGSLPVLNSHFSTDTLSLIARRESGNWEIFFVDKPQVTPLEANGYVAHGQMAAGATYLKIRRPDTADPREFYTSSEAFVRTILKALSWKRPVGREEVRIVSMGSAKEESPYVDAYGRKWQLRVWHSEYHDSLLIALALPTPDGYLAIVRWAAPPDRHDALEDLRWMANFAHFALAGSLSQWQEYLQLRDWLPESFQRIRLDYEYGRSFSYRSPRVELTIPQTVQKISAQTQLRLAFAYFDDGGATAWDVIGMAITEDLAMRQALILNRHARPPASLRQEFTVQWEKVAAREFPFDGAVMETNGTSLIAGVHPIGALARPSEAARVLYQLALLRPGKQDEREMQSLLRQAFGGLVVREPVSGGAADALSSRD